MKGNSFVPSAVSSLRHQALKCLNFGWTFMRPPPSVTRRIGVVPARRPGVRAIGRGSDGRPAIKGASAHVADAAHTDTAKTDTANAAAVGKPESVDEDRSRSVRAGQVALEDIHVEREPVAFKLRSLEHHDGITDRRSVLAENRNGGVGWILGEALAVLVSWRPFLKQVHGERMPRGPHRAIGEYDRVGRYADQRQLSTL